LEAEETQLVEAVAEARERIKAERKEERSRTRASKQDKDKLQALREQLKSLRSKLKSERVRLNELLRPGNDELKQRIREACQNAGLNPSAPLCIAAVKPEVIRAMLAEPWPAFWKRVIRIEQEAADKNRAARSASGLYSGTYVLLDKAAEAMRRSKMDPTFRRWTGEGRIGVHLQGGLRVGELYGCQDTRLRLQIQQSKSTKPSHRADKRRYGVLSIRVGTNGRAPVWAEFPVLVHRAIPEDAVIKDSWISVRKQGPRFCYKWQLQLESNAFARKATGTGCVAVDVGWRVMADGTIRAAFWRDDQGRSGQLLLPKGFRNRLSYADELRSIRDKLFNRAHRLARVARHRGYLPDCVKEDVATLGQWRSPARLARLAHRCSDELLGDDLRKELWLAWRDARLAAKQDLFASLADVGRFCVSKQLSPSQSFALALDLWRRKNAHLYLWECRQREKAQGCRRDLYRCFAVQMTREYELIKTEKTDLRAFARNAQPEESAEGDALHGVRRDVCPSELVAALQNAAGPSLMKVDAKNRTRTCHICGHVNTWEQAEERVQTCEGCGAEWDQDDNACRNMLDESFGGKDGPGGARKPRKHAAGAAQKSRPGKRTGPRDDDLSQTALPEQESIAL
jgi:hypothetical protein